MYANLIRGDFGELPVFVDFETNPNAPDVSVMQLKEFIEELKNLLVGKEIGIYTGYYYWKDNVPESMFDYFAQYSLWIAAYNNVGPLIPEPFKQYLFWQFTDKGSGNTYGTEGDVDLNYFGGDLNSFNQRFNLVEVPTIKHIYERKYDSDVHTVIVPKGSPIKIYATGYRNTVLSMSQKSGAKVAVNGGDYNPYTGNPTGIVAVDGLVRSRFEGFMPWLNVTAPNEVQINDYNSGIKPYNAVAGRRLLVVDGKLSPNTSPAWLEVHPKTFFGVTSLGELIIITVDGRTPQSRGVNLYEGAQLLIDADAVRGMDGGGGGDTTLVIDGEVVNVPIADTTPGELRPVADGVMVFGIMENPTEPPTQGDKMQFKVINSARFRSSPTMSTNDSGASSIVGEVFESPSIPRPDFNNSSIMMVQHSNLKWLPIQITTTEYTRQLESTPPPSDEHILHVKDGVTRKFIPE
jgi:exopolysaccharide biosynthesis protein